GFCHKTICDQSEFVRCVGAPVYQSRDQQDQVSAADQLRGMFDLIQHRPLPVPVKGDQILFTQRAWKQMLNDRTEPAKVQWDGFGPYSAHAKSPRKSAIAVERCLARASTRSPAS